MVYASPSIRKFARELSVDISKINGGGKKNRSKCKDAAGFVKRALQAPTAPGMGLGLELPAWPEVDFEKFGQTSRQKLPRIARISGPSRARYSVISPHLTSFENVGITDVDNFRKQVNAGDGPKMTILAFVMKAVVAH